MFTNVSKKQGHTVGQESSKACGRVHYRNSPFFLNSLTRFFRTQSTLSQVLLDIYNENNLHIYKNKNEGEDTLS